MAAGSLMGPIKSAVARPRFAVSGDRLGRYAQIRVKRWARWTGHTDNGSETAAPALTLHFWALGKLGHQGNLSCNPMK